MTLLTHRTNDIYVSSSSKDLVANNEVFNITSDQLQVFSLIYSTNSTINDNLDAYIGGTFLQITYDPVTQNKTFDYIQPSSCNLPVSSVESI